MVRMLIVGYCYGIRSERRLCEEAQLNLAYCWFCWLSLEDEVPDHSNLSKKRHGRFRDSDLFRWRFNDVLRRCMHAGLVKGEGFAVGASIIKADASRQRGVPGDELVTSDRVGAPAPCQKSQINPIMTQQRSPKGPETTQSGE